MELYYDRTDLSDAVRTALSKYALERLRWSHARILIVIDAGISLNAGAGAFGPERIVRLLRESTVGCMHFHVDTADHSNAAFSIVANPVVANPKYLGFKFNSKLPNNNLVIDQYDEIWCFGFGGPNTNDDELAALTTWMNAKKGGVFATGDHDTLGQSLCNRIPRVGTMRAWTNAQGVPPANGQTRIDTNRPFNADEIAGAEEIEFGREGDTLPQQIRWATWMSHVHWPFRLHRRPHPVLCHPTLGPIDVMPDHPHEGVVFDHVAQPDVGIDPITLTNNYDFNGVAGAEYPAPGGVQPLPLVIAHGNTLADPPLQHEKGDSPAKRFAMISVYDGHRADVGRVATDSTWHHWFNLNIAQIEAAGGDHWEKIKRYYLNLAVWLAPPHIRRGCFHLHALEAVFTYPGIEELYVKRPTLELGASFRKYLLHWHGPCWVTQWYLDLIGTLSVKFRERWIDRYILEPHPRKPFPPQPPEPCLSCPSPELFETMVLGGVIRSVLETIKVEQFDEQLARVGELKAEVLEKAMHEGALRGLQELSAMHEKSLEQSKQVLGDVQ